MERRESIVPAGTTNKKELLLQTILKVYAIRGAVEQRADENGFRNLPVLGDLAAKLSSTTLSKDQLKDVSAFVTASCPNNELLVLMEQIAAFKAKSSVPRPAKVLLSYIGLVLPLMLVIAAESLMLYANLLTQMPFFVLAFVMIIVAVIISVILFAHLGHDTDYRRDVIERAVWRAIYEECVRKLKKSGVVKTHARLSPNAKANTRQ